MAEIETPKLTVDVIVRLWQEDRFEGIVLIERKNPPLGLALPGGFVDIGERVEESAIREIKEEIGVSVQLLYLQGAYSDPGRDPRFHTVSLVFVGDTSEEPQAASDAKKAHVFKLEEVPFDKLVFDHRAIVLDFLKGSGPQFPLRLAGENKGVF